MKKLLFILTLFIYGISNAQIEQGNSLINVGVGFGVTFTSTGGDYKNTIPPVQASYEYAVADKFTVGAFVGYAASEFRASDIFGGEEFGFDYTYFLGGALGNWQFVNNESFNAYLGAKLGYVSITADQVGDSSFGFSAEASGIVLGGHIGARYFFSDAIGVNLEAGYGVSYLTAGLTFRF